MTAGIVPHKRLQLLGIHTFPVHFRNGGPTCHLRLPPCHKYSWKRISGKSSPYPKPETGESPPRGPDVLLLSIFRNLREGFMADGLGKEIISIALPAALALAADPITSLVDTAFVGHIGSADLAAVGVSASIFNLVSKLLNIPLLNVTTSFVAEEQALLGKLSDDSKEYRGKTFLSSVATSITLAAAVGILEAVVLLFGSSFLVNLMGISVDSPMRMPAEDFLSLRALGAPPIVIALAVQGTFRGFKNTKTPLYAVVAGNLLNAILDPILIFMFSLGVGGAAAATVISEYLIAFILLWELNRKVVLFSFQIDGSKLIRILKSGGLLAGRTVSLLITITLATSLAAREGYIPMAGHQICMQVWLSVSLLNDALALAGQTLLAYDYSLENYVKARQVIHRVLKIGLITGIGLGLILFLGFGAFSDLFTSDQDVLSIAHSGILFIVASQPINALAFVIDGLYYGVSDFSFAAYSMILVGLLSSTFLLAVAPTFGLAGIWTGLFLFMSLRVVAGMWRIGTHSGPWEPIWLESTHEIDCQQ